MAALLTGIVFIVGIFGLAFYESNKFLWLSVSTLLILLFTLFVLPWLGGLFFLILVGMGFLVLSKHWRRKMFTTPLLKWFKASQGSISKAEREVLQAGGLWWEAQIFSGAPQWEKLAQCAGNQLTAEEQAFLEGPVEKLCAMLDEWQIYQANDLPQKAWEYIKKERFWGLCIEKKFGGLGFSAMAHSAIVTKIASKSMTAAITVMVPNSLGPATFLENYGTESQQHYYLPRLAKGEEIACFALTSLEAGSDATSITDTGIVTRGEHNGKTCVGIRLTFKKRYITLAPVCTLIGLAFKLYDPEHLLGEQEERGITSAMVPSHLEGVKVGDRHQPMTTSFMNGPVEGREVFIPLEFVFGETQGVGRGWQMMMECLCLGRGISLPSLGSAANQVCFLVGSAYAKLRRQFKQPIGELEGVALALAKIGGLTYLAEATRLFTAAAVDAGARPAVASAIAKYHLTEFARESVNHAMDIHGGKAIQMGPSNYLAFLYNAIPISITVEGANILTRNLIIFGQGVVRAHPFLPKELEIASEKKEEHALAAFDKIILKHINFTVSRLVRTLVYGLSGGKLISVGSGKTKPYLQQLTRMSAAFAFVTDLTLSVLGAKFKFKESLSARFGDIVSHFYMASSVIAYYEKAKEKHEETPFMQWALSYCLANIQHSFDAIFANYPSRFLGWVLAKLVFPFGRAYQLPSDKLSLTLAKLMQTNSPLRDHLTELVSQADENNPVSRVNKVFKQTEQAELFLKLIPKSFSKSDSVLLTELDVLLQKSQISQEDYQLLKTYLHERINVIRVDEFNATRGSNEARKHNNEKERT